jgi:hypothetical protein
MPKERIKLDIKCGSSDCEAGMHCYAPKKPRNLPRPTASGCTKCGIQQVNWPRVHSKDVGDLRYLIDALKTERIRAYFWDKSISTSSKASIVNQGLVTMRNRIRSRLKSALQKHHSYREGSQTPLYEDGNPIHYAQHATATCCRRCLNYWHGVPEDRDMNNAELEYVEELIASYLIEKVPELRQ